MNYGQDSLQQRNTDLIAEAARLEARILALSTQLSERYTRFSHFVTVHT